MEDKSNELNDYLEKFTNMPNIIKFNMNALSSSAAHEEQYSDVCVEVKSKKLCASDSFFNCKGHSKEIHDEEGEKFSVKRKSSNEILHVQCGNDSLDDVYALSTQLHTKMYSKKDVLSLQSKPGEILSNKLISNDVEGDDNLPITELKIYDFHMHGNLILKPLLFASKEEFANIECATWKALSYMDFKNASQLLTEREKTIRITSGAHSIDSILDGGFEVGSITEIFGESGSGKSMLCHTLAVTCQLPVQMGGGNGAVVYIDTQGTFRPEIILSIAARYKLNPSEVCNKLLIARAYNTDHQLNLLLYAASQISSSKVNCKLLIVDAAIHLYRSEYTGRKDLHSRQTHLGKFLRILEIIASKYKVAVVITNEVVAIVDGSGQKAGCTELFKPAGGNIMAHACSTRIECIKLGKNIRKCKLFKSPHLPDSEALFAINSNGVSDLIDMGISHK